MPKYRLNDALPAEIIPLSLHDALPISFIYIGTDVDIRRHQDHAFSLERTFTRHRRRNYTYASRFEIGRATSELQSRENLVCRPLLEKKKPRSGRARRQTLASYRP